MSQSEEAWNEVADQLKVLGSTLKRHYRTQEVEDRAEPVDRDEIKDALRTLSDTVTAAFGALEDAIKDPKIQEEARETAGLFFDALGTSFSELGAEISNHGIRRKPEDGQAPDPDAETSDGDGEPPGPGV